MGSFFIGGGVPGPPETRPGFCIVASFLLVDEINAALPARNGSKAVEGLAVDNVSFRATASFHTGRYGPRSANEAADLVVDSILTTEQRKSAVKEWRVEGAGVAMAEGAFENGDVEEACAKPHHVVA